MPESRSNGGADATPSTLTLAAASFLVQALELADDPANIAGEFVTMKEDTNASIQSVQLDSSIGPAAFLVYAYALHETDASGASGQTLYDAGRETLTQAAERDTPGPRMVAHADTDAFGFILATTPATWRALQGEPVESVEATPADLPRTQVSEKERATIAEDLHKALREANRLAQQWLDAIPTAEQSREDDRFAFTEAETGLALHVMDDANVRPMLTALNMLIASAQEQAAGAVKPPDSTNQPS